MWHRPVGKQFPRELALAIPFLAAGWVTLSFVQPKASGFYVGQDIFKESYHLVWLLVRKHGISIVETWYLALQHLKHSGCRVQWVLGAGAAPSWWNRVLGLWRRGPCEAMPWPHHMNGVLTVAHIRVYNIYVYIYTCCTTESVQIIVSKFSLFTSGTGWACSRSVWI